MQTVRQVLVCVVLAALAIFLGSLTAGVYFICQTVDAIPRQMDVAIAETRTALLLEVAATRVELLKHMTALELRTDRRIGSIQLDLNSQLTRTGSDLNSQLSGTLSRVDVALAQAGGLVSEIAPVLVHLDKITARVDDALPLFADCDHNADCAFSRFQGTSKAIEKAAQDFSAMTAETRVALPAALLTWQRIGGNVDQTSGNIAKITKPRWYDQLFKGLGVGVALGAAVR